LRFTFLESLQKLYDQNRFLEAFRQTSEYWKAPPHLERFSVDELILAERLASRLGGWRLSRFLVRAASDRDPSSPRVRSFANRVRRRRLTLLEELRGIPVPLWALLFLSIAALLANL
jgi:hypothetical protein